MIPLLFLQNCVAAIPNLNLPDVCTASPERGKAFCKDHCALLQDKVPDVPLGLKEFLKYCGTSTCKYCGTSVHVCMYKLKNHTWLLTLMQQVEVPPKVVVAYDNMCNLAKLKVACNPLPFPPPLDSIWHNVDKIVDSFHVKNHVSAKCREQFSPARIKAENPNYNTQAGEQTFVWVGRFSTFCAL